MRAAVATLCLAMQAEQSSATKLTVSIEGLSNAVSTLENFAEVRSLIPYVFFFMMFMVFLWWVFRRGYRAGVVATLKKFETRAEVMIGTIDDEVYSTVAGTRIHLSNSCVYLRNSNVKSTKLCAACLRESRMQAEKMVETRFERSLEAKVVKLS